MLSHVQLLPVIQRVKSIVKKSKTIQDLYQQYDLDLDEVDILPVCFVPLDVSARTDQGVIYLNYALLKNPSQIPHYLAHEITHVVQQTIGDGPTQGSTDDTYLDNPFEIEGFQEQSKFITETEGKEEAEDYIDQVIEHHQLPVKEKDKKKKELLNISQRMGEWVKLGDVEILYNFWLLKYAGRKEEALLKYPQLAKEIDKFIQATPQGNLKYLDWELKILDAGQALSDEIIDVVNLFDKYKDNLTQKDINQYQVSDFTHLRDTLFEVKEKKQKREEKVEKRYSVEKCDAPIVYEDEEVIVRQIKNKDGAIHYGLNTKWCISMKGKNFFDDYDANNVVFFFVIRKQPEGDAYDKLAIVYNRDSDNNIFKVQYFDTQDYNISNLHAGVYRNLDKILSITISLAQQQPKSLLSKIESDQANEQEIEQVFRMGISGQESYLPLLLNCSKLPENIIKEMFLRGDVALQKELIKRRNFPAEFFQSVAEEPELILTLLSYKNLPADFLENMMDSPSPEVRKKITRQKNKTKDMVEKLSQDPSTEVREFLASAPDLPASIILELSQDPEELVRLSIVRRFIQDLPLSVLNILAKDPSVNVRCELAVRENLPLDIIRLLSIDPSPNVRIALTERRDLTPELIQQLLQDSNRIVVDSMKYNLEVRQLNQY